MPPIAVPVSPKYRTAPVPSTTMPRGIPYIISNEAAERFSFYGMKGILVVFMTKYLMESGGELAPMSEPEAKGWYHLFTSAVYFTPFFGALLSDIFLGKYRTIIGLSIVYVLGHLALALDETRLGLTVGLTLIAIGSGGIKPCVSAHVGDQFGRSNKHLLSKVFSWFYFSINLGAAASTLLIPWLLDAYGPRVAFGVPGLAMLLATIAFWMGRHKFVHVPPGGVKFFKETFSGEGLRAVGKVSIVFVFIAMFWALFDQTGSAWVLQADRMDRRWLGVEWLSSQIQAANPILIMVLIPIFTYALYPAIDKVWRLNPLRKIAIGFFVTAAAFTVSALIETRITGGEVFSTKATSMTTEPGWGTNTLLDGGADGLGWSSKAAPEFPQEIGVRLRERKAWTVEGVEINTWAKVGPSKEAPRTPEEADRDDPASWAREVEVLAGESVQGPWDSVARATLEQRPGLQRIGFAPVEASHVLVRVHSNWGGDRVKLGEVRVLASGSAPPAGARPEAAAVWPDVAGLGHRPSISWQLLAYVILTAAEVMVSITALEFAYTQAPRQMKSLIMSLYLWSVSLGNLFVAGVNYFIQNEDKTSKLEGASYYWFFTAAMVVTALLFTVVVRFYKVREYIQEEAGGPGPAGGEEEAEGVDTRA